MTQCKFKKISNGAYRCELYLKTVQDNCNVCNTFNRISFLPHIHSDYAIKLFQNRKRNNSGFRFAKVVFGREIYGKLGTPSYVTLDLNEPKTKLLITASDESEPTAFAVKQKYRCINNTELAEYLATVIADKKNYAVKGYTFDEDKAVLLTLDETDETLNGLERKI